MTVGRTHGRARYEVSRESRHDRLGWQHNECQRDVWGLLRTLIRSSSSAGRVIPSARIIMVRYEEEGTLSASRTSTCHCNAPGTAAGL